MNFNSEKKGEDLVCRFQSKTRLTISAVSEVRNDVRTQEVYTCVCVIVRSYDRDYDFGEKSMRGNQERQVNLVLKYPSIVEVWPGARGVTLLLYYRDEELHRGMEGGRDDWNPSIPCIICYVWSLGRFRIERRGVGGKGMDEEWEYYPGVNINTGHGLRCMRAGGALEEFVAFGKVEFKKLVWISGCDMI